MQKVQFLLHPSMIVTQALVADPRSIAKAS